MNCDKYKRFRQLLFSWHGALKRDSRVCLYLQVLCTNRLCKYFENEWIKLFQFIQTIKIYVLILTNRDLHLHYKCSAFLLLRVGNIYEIRMHISVRFGRTSLQRLLKLHFRL